MPLRGTMVPYHHIAAQVPGLPHAEGVQLRFGHRTVDLALAPQCYTNVAFGVQSTFLVSSEDLCFRWQVPGLTPFILGSQGFPPHLTGDRCTNPPHSSSRSVCNNLLKDHLFLREGKQRPDYFGYYGAYFLPSPFLAYHSLGAWQVPLVLAQQMSPRKSFFPSKK